MPPELLEQLQTALGTAFAVERELGGGGMSRVFVATETAFGRKVVAKVLHPALIEGVSVERFKREIGVVAKLQHPHIVPLLSAGESNGVLYYTMPFIDGESLRQRLEHDVELPVSDAVRVLREMSAALAYAHRHGIVHRDVKPDNVLFSDGTAVVTDFGIAKALTAARTHGGAAAGTLTQLGTSLGTPAYMSPEQVTADPGIDHRADIYALGCVGYELLAGRPPFAGRNAQAIMAAHTTEQPDDIARLRPSTPAPLAALIMQCLEKRPADRPQTAEEVGRALASVVITPGALTSLAIPPARNTGARRIGIGAALVVTGWAGAAAASYVSRDSAHEEPVRRWTMALPDTAPIEFIGSAPFGQGRPALAIAPDGSRIVYTGRAGATTMLYVRRLDEFDWRPVAGTEGAFVPFFSPDSRWIGFFAAGQLKKVAADGSGLTTLAQVTTPVDAAWLDDGRIVFVQDPTFVFSVPDAGGAATPITDIELIGTSTSSAISRNWLLAAPGRRLTLVGIESRENLPFTTTGVRSGPVTPETRMYGSGPRYARSGHVVFATSADEGTLTALPFDASRRRVTGPPKSVLRGVRQESGQDSPAQFAISDEGTLVYAPGSNAARVAVVLGSRDGRLDTLPLPRADYGTFRMSPDGRLALMSEWPPGAPIEFFIADLTRGTRVPIASRRELRVGGGQASWWPDGKSVVLFQTGTGGADDLTLRVSAATGDVVDTIARGSFVWAVSRDSSRFLARKTSGDLWMIPRDTARGGGGRVAMGPVFFASFSPDGRWIQYTTTIGGRNEIVVARTDNPTERQQVSRGGGEEGLWTADGREIVYRNFRSWYSVPVTGAPGNPFGAPRFLFKGSFANVPGWSHDVTPDGRRHMLLLSTSPDTASQLMVVTGWFSELRRLAPPADRE